MSVKINKKLNLVIPVEDENGKEFWLHSRPFSREAFQSNWLLLSQTFSLMIEQGIQVTAGPRVAAMVMKDLAEKQGRADDYEAIMAEVRRLTTVIKAGENGYEPMSLSSALARKVITQDDVYEAENNIIFFILASAMWKGDRLKASLTFMSSLWNVENTSLSVTEYIATLPILTETENTGETVAE